MLPPTVVPLVPPASLCPFQYILGCCVSFVLKTILIKLVSIILGDNFKFCKKDILNLKEKYVSYMRINHLSVAEDRYSKVANTSDKMKRMK